MAGSRPNVVAAEPSLSGRTTQSTPSTVTQSCVLGPRGSSPHRAMMAGSPHAATDPSSGCVATRTCPLTAAGQAARAHAGAAAWGASATSGARVKADSTTATPTRSAAVVRCGRPVRGRPSDVDDRAGQGPGDARDVLQLGDHQATEVVDVGGLHAGDDVVGTRDVLGEGHARDPGDLLRNARGLA